MIFNLDSYSPKIKEIEDKKYIFDVIRKKYLVLTPEEWVRQHFVNLLINHYGYSRSLIKMEAGLTYHQLAKRSDILVYKNDGSPFLLVECKSEDVKIDKSVLAQASRYNLKIRSPYLCVTNGWKTFCFGVDWENGTTVQLNDLPSF
ncbi:restriction endonuclease subunit R [Emticicia sp. CRIBPO]|jgi:hypothetical protein|uniref:type I restriction enzyme HsdR N-terminal domain-containing protein n=1 Tax=Emticicia sp. CRIBPO TaxID=2683258 RepID=UPI001412C646|nr:type I restriction enzyme HsdR N-terminal domain-containing protein [Emticicia sp. CRIBPO]NBA84893.1 restriction endonuclease subunit R [Emticicia sp. CRIBPO]